jgi:class 3 adenylate cyclase/pimeloyl-ACP methyl ester carboxylesterase
MAEERVDRRLAAIFAADVAGYSRLMGRDEEGTHAALKSVRHSLFDPKIEQHHGRIVKSTGDGALVEFASAVDAVRCAIEIQRGMVSRNKDIPNDRRIEFRIGINIGDIIPDEADIYGDGVNIATRLEGLARPNGLCISSQVHDQVEGKIPFTFQPLGPQSLKNIDKRVEAFALDIDEDFQNEGTNKIALTQQINYCRAPDQVRLAWAKAGRGPPLVRTANWLNHLEYDWQNPLRRAALQNLAKRYTLIRYDARGNGMSDWDVPEISLDAWVSDLETVVDAAGLERFPLLGISQGCAVSIAYAVRHPQRVSRLILYGGFALGGYKRSAEEREQRKAMMTLIKLGWGTDDPAFRQLFTSRIMPDATKEQADAFNELQRMTASADCAVKYYETVNNIDVQYLLPQVSVPTLVLHVRGDLMQPFEEGRKLAATIPGARFVALQGHNHMLLPGEPAALRFFEELELFLQRG